MDNRGATAPQLLFLLGGCFPKIQKRSKEGWKTTL
jgi:hypothetical protein